MILKRKSGYDDATAKFQLDLLQALGLEGRHVRKLVLTTELGSPCTVEVTEYIMDAGKLTEIVEVFRLVVVERD